MMNFIDLVIMSITIYLAFKFSFLYIFNKVKWKFVDKQEFLNERDMRYKNTFYANDFFKLEKQLISRGFKTSGIYVFTNKRTNRKYVGQSVDLIRRINEHLNGRGNPGVHRDMLLGDIFTIRLIKLEDTRYRNLDKLEKDYITKMNSYHNGYNKTRGNG